DPALLTGPIKKAMVSVSDDESKMVLCGVHIADYKIDAEDEQGKLEFAATNGHHLAVAVSEIDTPENWEPITVPTNALRSLIKLTGKGEVTIAADRALIQIEGENFTLISRLLEGEYPRYRQLIPAQFSRTVSFDVSDLTKALEYIKPYSNQVVDTIINVENLDDQLHITTKGSENGNADVIFKDCEIEGEPLLWSCKHRYLSLGLSEFKGLVTLHQNSATGPMVVKPQGDDLHTWLMMPVQVRDRG
ncbi:MAG TPA: DNA polymerase III subunit beta, partial [Candidatus Paceibacterota bacterium]|nr:DNA polymerase III subunit beta [Candidatus Paceibacterota bacterium]